MKTKALFFYCLLFTIPLLFLTSCSEEDFTPKPRGFFRIAIPQPGFYVVDKECPFVFEASLNAELQPYRNNDKFCWFDLRYTQFKATIHCSYDNMNASNRESFFEDARELAYKHVVKSSGIKEFNVIDTEQRVFGIIYEISGNTASSYQFYLTDSVRHFFRGSLYYDFQANLDSVAPVTSYLKNDINRIVETFRWK